MPVTPRQPGLAVLAALRFSTDAKASLFEASLARRQNNPGQMVL